MRVIFMGTPEFAVGALQQIIAAKHQVVLVVTQPDKPKGRGKEMQFTPVKECALQNQIPLFQPQKIKTEEAKEVLKSYQADVFVVAAFGQLLSNDILEMPKYGCINIHASLLPKYRGAAPIQWAIIDGQTESGVTIMQMDIGIDTGDMLLKKVVPIEEKETGDSLQNKLSQAGAMLIVQALEQIEKNEIIPVKQTEDGTCYAKRLTKSLGKIEWNQSALTIERLIRGLNSWPCAYTYYKGKTLKIWEADVIHNEADGEPGMIAQVTKDGIIVNTGKEQLVLRSVQAEGKRRMAVKEFLLGNQIKEQELLDQA